MNNLFGKLAGTALLLVCAASLAVGSAVFWHEQLMRDRHEIGAFSASAVSSNKDTESDSVTLMFVGDIMLDRGVAYELKKQEKDWEWLVQPILPTLKEADILFGNLESVISDKGYNVGSIYSFRAPPESMNVLTAAGFDAVSVANNHSFDYTRLALEDSMKRLDSAGIIYSGGGFSEAEAYQAQMIERKGLTLAVLSYTGVGSPAWQAHGEKSGIAWLTPETLSRMEQEIRRASLKADIVAVSLHAGTEYQSRPNAFQVQAAHRAIDAGADLFIGHHAHVLQPIRKYKTGWIAYGLGNFLFDQDFSEATKTSGILKAVVQDNGIARVEFIGTQQTDSFQVELRGQNQTDAE